MATPRMEAAHAIVRDFAIDGEFVGIERFERGHIHDTFVSTWRDPAGATRRYLHQRVNDHVFRDVPALMHNIEAVTNHLRSRGSEHELRTLELVPTRKGQSWLRADDGPWRTYVFLEGTRSFDLCTGPEQAYAAAHAFGSFQAELSDLGADALRETIPAFFCPRHRLEELDAVLGTAPDSSTASARGELAFVDAHRHMIDQYDRALCDGSLSRRVAHGDTKLNNVLFDIHTGATVCVVDLDTCMPAWSLYDFGDLVRFTAACSNEDERDLELVGTDPVLYTALCEGYLDAAGGFLSEREIRLMPFAARLVTFTIGLRFLTDHLAGDVYFKVARDGHNLDRARVQFRMVELMERDAEAMAVRLSDRYEFG